MLKDDMTHPLASALDALKTYEQPTVTLFIQECLTDSTRSLHAGLFCAMLGHALNKMQFEEALAESHRLQSHVLGENCLTEQQSRELAMAAYVGKVNAAKCRTCRVSFLTDESHTHQHCFEHHSKGVGEDASGYRTDEKKPLTL